MDSDAERSVTIHYTKQSKTLLVKAERFMKFLDDFI